MRIDRDRGRISVSRQTRKNRTGSLRGCLCAGLWLLHLVLYQSTRQRRNLARRPSHPGQHRLHHIRDAASQKKVGRALLPVYGNRSRNPTRKRGKVAHTFPRSRFGFRYSTPLTRYGAPPRNELQLRLCRQRASGRAAIALRYEAEPRNE